MKEYKTNELEEFEHPYELDYSSLKSSKNESLKIQNIKENNKNLLGINNKNNNNININHNNKISNFQKSNNADMMNNNINYNQIPNNYRLNEANKKNIENLIGTNSNNIKNKNKSNSKPKNSKVNKNIRKNSNNIHVYSTVNDYWNDREKKNKVKMEKIRKERYQKKYGEIYPIPKINKNSQEIIEKIKERAYDITAEDQIEDKINNKIPIKTKLRKNFFQNNFINKSFGNSAKTYRSSSKLKIKNGYNNSMKIKINNKRAKTPNQRKINKKKIKKNSIKKISMADFKNYEAIIKLRNDEENRKRKELEEKIKEENEYIEEQIKKEQEKNSLEKIRKEEKKENSENFGQKIENYLNKSMNLFSLRNKNINEFSNINQNINELITSRRYLNDIYNRDKKIINHSFIQSNSISTIPKCSNQRNIKIFYKTKPKIKKPQTKTIPKMNKQINALNSFTQNDSNKDLKNIGLYNPQTKSLRYRHYTELPTYSYNRENINDKNSQLNYIRNMDNSPDKINKNVIYFNPPKQRKNDLGIINNVNKIYEFNREKIEDDNEINLLKEKEYNYKSEEINKIQNELEENSKLNQSILNEAKKLKKIYNNEYRKIILKNESINKMYNEIDNESLLKFREENNQKLHELKQRNNKNKFNFTIYSENNLEESKNINNQIDKETNKIINIQKLKNIINGEQQKMENNLDYFNNELKINAKKKELLLNKMFGDDYTKKLKINNHNLNEINIINGTAINGNYGVDKYLVKNFAFDLNKNNNKSEFNKYKLVYSPFKMINGIKQEVKKDDLLEEEDDIVGNFEFQRKEHFS